MKWECVLLRSPEVPSHLKKVVVCEENKTPKSCYYLFIHQSSYRLPLHSPVPFTHSPHLPPILFIASSPMQLLTSPSSTQLPSPRPSYPFTHPSTHVRHGFEIPLKLQFTKPCSFSCITVFSSQQGTVALVSRAPASPSSLQLLVWTPPGSVLPTLTQ